MLADKEAMSPFDRLKELLDERRRQGKRNEPLVEDFIEEYEEKIQLANHLLKEKQAKERFLKVAKVSHYKSS